MAKRVIEVLVDDLTGTEIKSGEGESIEFAYRGTSYSIDLTRENADRFDQALATYIAAATKTSGRRARPTRRVNTKADSSAVRAWAASNNIQLAARGRIPGSVLEQYEAAGN